MTAAPPERGPWSLLRGASPNFCVKDSEIVPSPRLQILHHVRATDGSSLMLALPPPPNIRLLRSEQSAIGVEAAVLKWLDSNAKRKGAGMMRVHQPSTTQGGPEDLQQQQQQHQTKKLHPNAVGDGILAFTPVLVRYEPPPDAFSPEYSLSHPPRGVAISVLPQSLNNMERRAVDYQTGQLVRRISLQISPTRRFGAAADVFNVPLQQGSNSSPKRRMDGLGLRATQGSSSWSVAFRSMLESVLRDAEDLSVMVGYGAVRRHLKRFEHLLDAVTVPRLVVIDACDGMNTLVQRVSDHPRDVGARRDRSIRSMGSKRFQQAEDVAWRVPEMVDDSSEETTSEDSELDESDTESLDAQGRRLIEVTGLRQWSNCVFGDPLMTTVFNKHPTPAFWRGFNSPLYGEGGGPLGPDPRPSSSSSSSSSLVEDTANAHIRLLLYECYHATVSLVKEFYRPQSDSGRRELAARRQLSSVLERLDSLDDDGHVRKGSPSSEVSPAKRSKSDSDSGKSE